MIVDGKVGSWETITLVVETEGVNPVSVKLLGRDDKYIYTHIKKNSPVQSRNI